MLARSITICAVALYVAGCGGRPAERYLLPEGFAGYMEVTYQVPGAPSLPYDAEGFRIVHVPEDGKVATSEPMLSGESHIHEYYYVLADGSRQRAPTLGGYTITDMSGREQHRWYVFIGERSDLDRYKRLYGDDPRNVRPGRIGVAPSN